MVELEPWIILVGEATEQHVAMWRVTGREDASLAIFSNEQRATDYAGAHCPTPVQIRQLNQRNLIQLLVSCFQQGTQHAALDPDERSARQIFVVRDVLTAARKALKNSKRLD